MKTMPESNSFQVRTAMTADIPALLALIEQSVRQLQVDDYSPTQIEASLGSAFGVDRQLIADQTYFVATSPKDPAQIVACGGWSFRKTLCGSDSLGVRDNSILNPLNDFAKIRAIFVHPTWGRQGLGSLMLSYCEQAAQRAGFTRFEMGSTLTGVRLYSQRGYVAQGRADLRLTNGEDLAIVMMSKCL
jgi:N-acetylglutamate synthase-like GNAT family acetyltransferase